MKTLTMTQLRKRYETAQDLHFIYDNSNNEEPQQARSLHVDIVTYYDKMIIMLSPNVICFKSESNTISFRGVKEITLDDKKWYDILYITCRNETTKYAIIAQYAH